MGRFQAVVFDYGNVLVMVDRLAQCQALARHSSLPAGEIVERIWGNELEREAETGKFDSREQFRRIKERIAGEASWSYEEFREEFASGFELNPEGLRALRFAVARGRRTFILSNISYLHARLLFLHEELTTLPEGYVFSFKIRAMKPDPAIWQYLLRTTGLTAGECVYIDDVPAFCQAAERLGFTTIHYVRGSTDLLQRLEDLL
jgi:putative hydrolase of the HAD superfamily